MNIENRQLYIEAETLLKGVYGPDAMFREGQYEAIEATMKHKRTLVVQKTGWGKSLVYFICAKLMRSQGKGMTLVISPLLSLMDNQVETARGIGLDCATLNSRVRDKDERLQILERAEEGKIDILFTTPETLLSNEVDPWLSKFSISLIVVDEAHCISDWGNDFRLEYGRIGRIISGQFSNIAVLATTATANDRVVNDLKRQLGDDVHVSRGPLTRESLHIQVLPIAQKTYRYAWLLDNLPRLPGSGIIYCIDRKSCDYLADFLNKNGVSVMSYHSGRTDESLNDMALEAFRQNKIKAIVATVKLGMGYDKGDVAFVIHYQAPASIVTWYQQIGRAGRNIKEAYVFLMTGEEDDAINNYFINTAFPEYEEAECVMRVIENSNGVSIYDLQAAVNIRPTRIRMVLSFMENEGFVHKDGSKYYPTLNNFRYNGNRYAEVTRVRRGELEQMHRLVRAKECISRFAVSCLDDKSARNCGKCANCIGGDVFPGLTISEASLQKASDYINSRILTIEPRKKWPNGTNIAAPLVLKPGLCISKYGDPGYGELVKQGKYPSSDKEKRFDDKLVAKAASVLKELIKSHEIDTVTFVPSLRSNLVKDFTERLAKKTGLHFAELLLKTDAPQQKTMENSGFQCKNAMNSFSVLNVPMPEKAILVDDVVDSRWTLTVCGCKILERGCKEVFPFALADSSYEEV